MLPHMSGSDPTAPYQASCATVYRLTDAKAQGRCELAFNHVLGLGRIIVESLAELACGVALAQTLSTMRIAASSLVDRSLMSTSSLLKMAGHRRITTHVTVHVVHIEIKLRPKSRQGELCAPRQVGYFTQV